MKAVFTRVEIIKQGGNIDISDYIEYLRHESDAEKGSLLELRCFSESDKAASLANNSELKVGAGLKFQYGLTEGAISSVRIARITDISVDIDTRISLKIKALDKGIETKKGTSQKIWRNMKLSDIVREIANSYGMSAMIESETATKYQSLPQANRSDFQLLQYLSDREPQRDGKRWQVVFSDNNIILSLVDLGKNAKKLYSYGENIISVNFSLKETTQKSSSNSVSSLGIDEKSGKIQTAESQKNDKTLGKYSAEIKQSRVFSTESGVHIQDAAEIKRTNASPTANKQEAAALATSEKQKAAKKSLTANLRIELDTSINVGDIVSLQTPIMKFNGNWYIAKVTHTLQKSAITEIELQRNATNKNAKQGATANANTNTKQAETDKAKKTQKRVFENESGKQIKSIIE